MLLVVSIAAIAFAGIELPDTPYPQWAIVAPVCYLIAVLGDIAAAVILLATWRTVPARRSTVVLALLFLADASMLFVSLLSLPLLPTVPPFLNVPDQYVIWILVFRHVLFACGAIAYMAFRRFGDAKVQTPRFTLAACAIVITCTWASIVAALALCERGPTLSVGDSIAGLLSSGVGPGIAILLTLVAFAAFGMRQPSGIDRALALALLALATETLLLLAGGHLYGSIFFARRVLAAVGALFVPIAAIRTLLDSRTLLVEIETTLSAVADESARRAGRIRAVWQIAAQTETSQRRTQEVLDIAMAALRPGKPMMGFLSRLDRENLIIDTVAYGGYESSTAEIEGIIHAGSSFPAVKTMTTFFLDGDGAKAWDDLGSIASRYFVADNLRLRSFIGKRISVAGQTHFLTFASRETMIDEPFAEDDIAYVDVVASFFASRFQEQRQFERIQFEVEHDGLTGLENRTQFRAAIRDEIRTGKSFALAVVDLDGFRHVNEREGHQVGDEVLVEAARALVAVRPSNLVGRMSGDQFGVLVRGVASLESATLAVDAYAHVFRKAFDTHGRTGEHALAIGASIGAARFPENGTTAEDVLRRADVALGVAKQRGASSTALFDASMEAILETTRLRVVELESAIAGDQLALVYQPTFDLKTRRILGAEALVRWDHPERGRLPPAEFVDFAERNNLIGPLTLWVFRRIACDLTSRSDWPAGFRAYFNVSAQMLDDVPFITVLDATLRGNPGLNSRLGIEVTETAAMQNVERSMNTIDLFRRWGLTVAIDDFGTGYSSLSYLKQLTVDVIKIDRSFVMGLPDDERDNAIAELLLRIIDRFGFTSLAEGIETEAQLAWLLAHGCRLGQGFLVSRPEAFEVLLDRLGMIRAA